MSASVTEVERQIRQMTPDEQSKLIERIDDLLMAEWGRVRADNRDAALKIGIDPEDDEAVQRLVNKARYGNPDGRVG